MRLGPREFDPQTLKSRKKSICDLWLPDGRGGGRDKLDLRISRYTQLSVKQINNEDLLCSSGHRIQYLVIIYSGKEYRKRERES